jgi:hypothetical protein
MKKNKWALWIIVVIVAATAVTAVVFRSMQNAITGIEIADGSRLSWSPLRNSTRHLLREV